jgi:hypothetical protein
LTKVFGVRFPAKAPSHEAVQRVVRLLPWTRPTFRFPFVLVESASVVTAPADIDLQTVTGEMEKQVCLHNHASRTPRNDL